MDLCLICTNRIEFGSIGQCDHRVCHVCSLRLRRLYKSSNCPLCKTLQSEIVVSEDLARGWSELRPVSFPVDPALGVFATSNRAKLELERLTRLNCPFKGCRSHFGDKRELEKHVSHAHSMHLCSVCLDCRQVFSHEYRLFSSKHSLERHIANGEDGLRGHPECRFCRRLFYSDDELFEHCRERHEECHICRNSGTRHVYYDNYQSLEEHFRERHFLCSETSCLEKKFVVFATEIEYKAHMGSLHVDSRRLQRSLQRHAHSIGASYFLADGEAARTPSSSGRRGPHATRGSRQAAAEGTLPDAMGGMSVSEAQPAADGTLRGRILAQVKDLCSASPAVYPGLDALCKRHRDRSLACRDFVGRCFRLLGDALFDRVMHLLADAEEDAGLGAALRKEVDDFIQETAPFPALPASSGEPGQPAVQTRRGSQALPAPQRARVIRLVNKPPVPWGDQARRLSRASRRAQPADGPSAPRPAVADPAPPRVGYHFGPAVARAPASPQSGEFPPIEPEPAPACPRPAAAEATFTLGSTPAGAQPGMPIAQPPPSTKRKPKRTVLFHVG